MGLESVGKRLPLLALGFALLLGVNDASARGKASTRHASPEADAGTKPLDPTIAVPVLGIGAGINLDDSDVTNELDQGGGAISPDQDEPEGQESTGSINLQAWALYPAFFDRLLVGGSLGWYNKYGYIDPEEEDEDRGYEIGHMFSLAAQAEFLVPQVLSKLNVVVGLRAGLLLAFASGDLEEDLEEYDNIGFSVEPDLPRTGWFVGPHLGLNWPFTDRLRLRVDGGVQFASLNLWSGIVEDSGVTSRRAADLQTTRILFVIGPEFTIN